MKPLELRGHPTVNLILMYRTATRAGARPSPLADQVRAELVKRKINPDTLPQMASVRDVLLARNPELAGSI